LCSLATDRTKPWGGVNYTPAARDVEMWLGDMAHRRDFNSLIVRLSGWEPWDGVERLGSWLARYTGHLPWDSDYEYTRRVGEHWMVNWVARMQRPGHKHDEVPVFVGFQGERKTDAASAMADVVVPNGAITLPNLDFDASNGINQMAIQTVGKALVEYAELEHLSGSKQANIKSRISARVDSGRGLFGKDRYDRLRQFGVLGTANVTVQGHDAADITNELARLPEAKRDAAKRVWMSKANTGFLIDPTGARRWHGVTVLVYKMDLEGLALEVPQLIAEARARIEDVGYDRLYMSPEMEALVSAQVSRFYVTSGLEEDIAGALQAVELEDYRISAFNLRKLLGLDTHQKKRDLSAAMRRLGFVSYTSNGLTMYLKGDMRKCGEPLAVLDGPGVAKLVPRAKEAGAANFSPGA
jgi:predicted P-loop ATPase